MVWKSKATGRYNFILKGFLKVSIDSELTALQIEIKFHQHRIRTQLLNLIIQAIQNKTPCMSLIIPPLYNIHLPSKTLYIDNIKTVL